MEIPDIYIHPTSAQPVLTKADSLISLVITVGKNPPSVAVNPKTNRIYVANYGDNTVSVIDGKTNSVVNTVKVGKNPEGVAVNPSTNMIYVTNNRDNTTSVIDSRTNSVVETIKVGSNPYDVAVNPIKI